MAATGARAAPLRRQRNAEHGQRRRPAEAPCSSAVVAFHAGNGCVSLLGSLALLPLLVGVLHLHYLVANLVTIAATGLLNFLISDRLVFAAGRPVTATSPDRELAGLRP